MAERRRPSPRVRRDIAGNRGRDRGRFAGDAHKSYKKNPPRRCSRWRAEFQARRSGRDAFAYRRDFPGNEQARRQQLRGASSLHQSRGRRSATRRSNIRRNDDTPQEAGCPDWESAWGFAAAGENAYPCGGAMLRMQATSARADIIWFVAPRSKNAREHRAMSAIGMSLGHSRANSARRSDGHGKLGFRVGHTSGGPAA